MSETNVYGVVLTPDSDNPGLKIETQLKTDKLHFLSIFEQISNSHYSSSTHTLSTKPYSLSDRETHLGHYSLALKISLTFKVITKDCQKPIAGRISVYSLYICVLYDKNR